MTTPAPGEEKDLIEGIVERIFNVVMATERRGRKPPDELNTLAGRFETMTILFSRGDMTLQQASMAARANLQSSEAYGSRVADPSSQPKGVVLVSEILIRVLKAREPRREPDEDANNLADRFGELTILLSSGDTPPQPASIADVLVRALKATVRGHEPDDEVNNLAERLGELTVLLPWADTTPQAASMPTGNVLAGSSARPSDIRSSHAGAVSIELRRRNARGSRISGPSFHLQNEAFITNALRSFLRREVKTLLRRVSKATEHGHEPAYDLNSLAKRFENVRTLLFKGELPAPLPTPSKPAAARTEAELRRLLDVGVLNQIAHDRMHRSLVLEEGWFSYKYLFFLRVTGDKRWTSAPAVAICLRRHRGLLGAFAQDFAPQAEGQIYEALDAIISALGDDRGQSVFRKEFDWRMNSILETAFNLITQHRDGAATQEITRVERHLSTNVDELVRELARFLLQRRSRRRMPTEETISAGSNKRSKTTSSE